ncbi:2-dehydropantoate 2-reductase [bacterium]|nr:2-dehydropantoate 2-reductase [bacterium]MCP5462333.1 2-dehydropantoate 2-reductase [bacterium]
MKILVFGSGAVGLGLSTFLIKNYSDVTLIARENVCNYIMEHGLRRTGIFGECFLAPSECKIYAHLNQLPAITKRFDYVLVCTKSYDTFTAAKLLKSFPSLFDKKTVFILFQNGWGNGEVFAHFFSEQMIFNARIITGFYRVSINHVSITVHAADIHIGSLFQGNLASVKPLVDIIKSSGFPCSVTDVIEKDLWAKMLYNCALNPLGALFHVPYGALAEEKYSRDIMNEIIFEAFAVMNASGFKTHWKSAEEYLSVFYDTLVPSTASHESSMLQDIKSHKQTEIEGLNGALLILGKKTSIPLPCNRLVYNMIKFIEQSYAS